MPRLSKTAYIKRASKRFLDGTGFRSPIDAVEAGVRSLEEWTELLSLERESELEQLKEVRLKRRALNRKPLAASQRSNKPSKRPSTAPLVTAASKSQKASKRVAA